VIERAVIATTGRTLQMPSVDRREHRPVSSARTLKQVEREHIVAIPQVGLEPTRLRFATPLTGCEATARPRRSSPSTCAGEPRRNPPVNRLMRVCYLVGSEWVSFRTDSPITRCSGANCSLIVHCSTAPGVTTPSPPARGPDGVPSRPAGASNADAVPRSSRRPCAARRGRGLGESHAARRRDDEAGFPDRPTLARRRSRVLTRLTGSTGSRSAGQMGNHESDRR